MMKFGRKKRAGTGYVRESYRAHTVDRAVGWCGYISTSTERPSGIEKSATLIASQPDEQIPGRAEVYIYKPRKNIERL